MTKSKKDVQREIYNFIEEEYVEGRNVILQQILDKFCKKYNASEPTITRYVNELVEKRTPFRLITWYDGRRYYSIYTISFKTQVILVLSVFVPIGFFLVDLLTVFAYSLFERCLMFIAGFWFSMWMGKEKNNKHDFFSKRKIKKGLNKKRVEGGV